MTHAGSNLAGSQFAVGYFLRNDRSRLSPDSTEPAGRRGRLAYGLGRLPRGRPHFRHAGAQGKGYGNLMLTPEQQADFVAERPDVFLPVPGGWGRNGATHLRLAEADEDLLTGALQAAWKVRTAKNAKADGKKRSSSVRK